ncbi:MAG: hypothetical protein WA197_06630 [Candidatus Acidiferrales bacterium]
MTKPKTTPKPKAIDRKRISEALLADRLGLNEEWIERWEERGKIREESHMPDGLPAFIHMNYKEGEIEEIKSRIERLVAAGCRQQVVYFCLAQLSPETTRLRAGVEKQPVFRNEQEDAIMYTDYERRLLATREDLEAVANTAKAVRKKIHRYQRELFLVAESSTYRLPVGFECRPKNAIEALDLLQDSLTWLEALADAYTAPMETTLLKSKGLLYLTLYVSMFADSKKLLGSRPSDFHRDSSKPSETVVARRTLLADDPLTYLAVILSGKHKDGKDKGNEQKNRKDNASWSVSDLHRKLADFKEDHPPLYKRLVVKLKELHNFASR